LNSETTGSYPKSRGPRMLADNRLRRHARRLCSLREKKKDGRRAMENSFFAWEFAARWSDGNCSRDVRSSESQKTITLCRPCGTRDVSRESAAGADIPGVLIAGAALLPGIPDCWDFWMCASGGRFGALMSARITRNRFMKVQARGETTSSDSSICERRRIFGGFIGPTGYKWE